MAHARNLFLKKWKTRKLWSSAKNIELYELGQISGTVQCRSYAWSTYRMDWPSVLVARSRGKKHGETQWQQDHWKVMNARRVAWKHKKGTIVIRWREDEKYRTLQQAHGWTENIAGTRTTSRRSTSLALHPGIRGTGTRAPPRCMQRWGSSSWFQTYYENSHKSSTRTRTTEFLYSEERDNEAKTIRWSIVSRIRMDESKLENLFLAAFFLFIIFTKLVATRTSRLSMAWTPKHSTARSPMAKSPVVEKVKATDSLQDLCGSHFARFLRIRGCFVKEFRLQAIAFPCSNGGAKTEHFVARTFFSVLSVFRTW